MSLKTLANKLAKAAKKTEEKLDKMLQDSFEKGSELKEKIEDSKNDAVKKFEKITDDLDEKGTDFMLDPLSSTTDLAKKLGTGIISAGKNALKKTEEVLDKYIEEEEWNYIILIVKPSMLEVFLF